MGEVIRLEGFDSLSASKSAHYAEVDKFSISRYFGWLRCGIQLILAHLVKGVPYTKLYPVTGT